MSEMSRGTKTIAAYLGITGATFGSLIASGSKLATKIGAGKAGVVGAVAGALLGIVSHLVGKNQIDKSCNENLGELKDHPYAKERIDYLK